MTLAVLILAAGSASRMGPGRDKLAEDVAGQPLLTHTTHEALATGLQVYACLPGPTHPRVAFLPEGVMPIWVPQADEGMGASIRTGVRALPEDVSAVMILPADMPELTGTDLQVLAAAHHPGQITRGASQSGEPGHPVIFPKACFVDLGRLSGDRGARAVLTGFDGPVVAVPLPHEHALVDLDTPEAWATWRQANSARDS